jgi:hypothetical protein
VYPPIVAPNSPSLGGTSGSGINGPSVFLPGQAGVSSRFLWITTPIAYITSVFRDPFIPASVGWALAPDGSNLLEFYDTYDYVDARSVTPEGMLGGDRGASITSGAQWRLVSAGPDRINAFGGSHTNAPLLTRQRGVDYDPTNGTLSEGDIVRVGGGQGPYPGTLRPTYNRITGEWNLP